MHALQLNINLFLKKDRRREIQRRELGKNVAKLKEEQVSWYQCLSQQVNSSW